MKRHAIFLLLFLLPLAALADALPSVPYVQVSGHGTLTVVPDMVHVALTVGKTDKNLTAARADVERRASQVIESAKKLGIPERDISATTISVWPQYQWQNNTQVFVGEHVSRHIEITLRDITHYADLVSALVKAGVTNISSTTLDRSDMPQLRRQALAKAVDDAHARAAALADAAGVSLGSVYNITENTAFTRPRPVMMAAKVAPSGGAEYESGTIEVTADVSIVYLLKKAH
ncbi:MAG: SIMPL domain-containing protein [Gammaproteobacteria bacterium]